MSRPGVVARRGVASLLVWLGLVSGCAPAVRFTQETADGGVIRMPANTNQWPSYYRSRAAYLMQQKCPTGYRIDKEGPIGGPASVSGNSPPHDSYFGYTGGSDLAQIYQIAFHAVPSGKSRPADAPAGPTKKTPPPAATEDKEDLPPPHPLPPVPAGADKAP